MGVSFKGGEKTQAFFKNAGEGGVKSVDVGVFQSAKYPDGTPVAEVLAYNEFGTEDIPERPAFRNANTENGKNLVRILKKRVDPKTMVVTKQIAGVLGANHQGAVQKSIVVLKSPANAPKTIKAKKSSNPLVDTGFMSRSVTHKVNG